MDFQRRIMQGTDVQSVGHRAILLFLSKPNYEVIRRRDINIRLMRMVIKFFLNFFFCQRMNRTNSVES